MPKDNRPDRRFEKKQFRLRLFFDVLSILVAWYFSYGMRFYVLPGGMLTRDTLSFFISVSSIAVISTFLVLYSLGMYETKTLSRRDELAGLFKASFTEFCVMVVIYYYLFISRVSRLHLAVYMISLFFFLLIGRKISSAFLRFASRKGKFNLNVLLVGRGSRLENYYKTILQDSSTRLKVSGQFLYGDFKFDDLRAIDADNLSQAVEKACADIVVISFPDDEYSVENEMINQSLDLFKQQVYVIPKIPATYTGADLSEVRNIPMIQLNYSEMSFGSRFIKRTFDVVSCSLGVLVLSPLYILLAILVKLSSKGPVFFKQKRVTSDGKVFEMLKFRSMRTDMPEGKVHWTTEDDPRVTKIGKILRKTSLDEIPQFFNVIAGDMSLIGPRPERPELEQEFVKTIPGYYMRHRMKAGITGWAQVNGLRGNTSLEKRIEFDLYYIRNWSILFDIKVFFLTFFSGFVNKNAY